MQLNGKKIGYWPYRNDCQGAGDRRRFIFYAKEKNIKFETASYKQKYDIVYLTVGCNIHQWMLYKKKHPEVKIVFEVLDSYFLETLNNVNAFRGLVKFITGKETRFFPDYRKAIIQMVKVADGVVCATPIQKDFFMNYNKNIHVSLDFFSDDIVYKKTDYSTGEKLKLVWEGQAYTVHNLLYLIPVLKKFGDQLELHIITDPEIKYPFKIFNKETAALLASLPTKHVLYTWKKETFSKIISEMDLAIIPFNDKKFGILTMNKPENKLLLFWEVGIPTLTSNSPAYARVMQDAGLEMICDSLPKWKEKIQAFINLKIDQKKESMTKAGDYLKNHHSKEIIISKWDKIFESLYS